MTLGELKKALNLVLLKDTEFVFNAEQPPIRNRPPEASEPIDDWQIGWLERGKFVPVDRILIGTVKDKQVILAESGERYREYEPEKPSPK